MVDFFLFLPPFEQLLNVVATPAKGILLLPYSQTIGWRRWGTVSTQLFVPSPHVVPESHGKSDRNPLMF